MTTATKTKKITRATIKSFVCKNRENLFIRTASTFDGMVDGCRDTGEMEFSPARKPDRSDSHNMGIAGAWFVLGSRDYFRTYDDGTFHGFEISNSCGNFYLVTRKAN